MKYESDHVPPWGILLFRVVFTIFLVLWLLIFNHVCGYHPFWHQTRGELQHFEYKEYGRTCDVETTYSYSVNGVAYVGTQFWDGAKRPLTRDADAWRHSLADAAITPVFYDPSNPAHSVLWNRPALDNPVIHWSIMAACAAAIPLIWITHLVRGLRSIRSRAAKLAYG